MYASVRYTLGHMGLDLLIINYHAREKGPEGVMWGEKKI